MQNHEPDRPWAHTSGPPERSKDKQSDDGSGTEIDYNKLYVIYYITKNEYTSVLMGVVIGKEAQV